MTLSANVSGGCLSPLQVAIAESIGTMLNIPCRIGGSNDTLGSTWPRERKADMMRSYNWTSSGYSTSIGRFGAWMNIFFKWQGNAAAWLAAIDDHSFKTRSDRSDAYIWRCVRDGVSLRTLSTTNDGEQEDVILRCFKDLNWMLISSFPEFSEGPCSVNSSRTGRLTGRRMNGRLKTKNAWIVFTYGATERNMRSMTAIVSSLWAYSDVIAATSVAMCREFADKNMDWTWRYWAGVLSSISAKADNCRCPTRAMDCNLNGFEISCKNQDARDRDRPVRPSSVQAKAQIWLQISDGQRFITCDGKEI